MTNTLRRSPKFKTSKQIIKQNLWTTITSFVSDFSQHTHTQLSIITLTAAAHLQKFLMEIKCFHHHSPPHAVVMMTTAAGAVIFILIKWWKFCVAKNFSRNFIDFYRLDTLNLLFYKVKVMIKESRKEQEQTFF